MTRKKRALFIVISVLGIALLGLAVLLGTLYFSMTSTVITKRSPDGQHTAKLKKKKWVDVNFIVSVDDNVIYGSPDVRPTNVDFREQLIWGTNSQRVLLEVAGERIFGYDVKEKRPLTSAELQDFHFTPFSEIYFDGTLRRSTNALTNTSSSAHPPAP